MTVERLAYLLARYDLDPPYGDGEEPPSVSLADFRSWLDGPHEGDCTGAPGPCARCHAEYWLEIAEWVIAQGDGP